MWIILTTKLPTEFSPPKLSIHWSTEWPDEERTLAQFKHYADPDPDFFLDQDGNKLRAPLLRSKMIAYMQTQPATFYTEFGEDPNWALARRIHYKENDIRVFRHEFNYCDQSRMADYIGYSGRDDTTHELVPGSVAADQIYTEIMEGDLREIYDAALVDGCTHSQALGMALGIDVSVSVESNVSPADFPPIGWYRCKPDYAMIFCYDWELAE